MPIRIVTNAVTTTCFVLIVCSGAQLPAQETQNGEAAKKLQFHVYVPDTVSPRARQILRQMTGPQTLPLPAPNDIAGWEHIRDSVVPQDLKEIFKETAASAMKYPSTSENRTLGGVPVVEIRPKGWKDDGKVLVYTHGGGYVTGGPDFFTGRLGCRRNRLSNYFDWLHAGP